MARMLITRRDQAGAVVGAVVVKRGEDRAEVRRAVARLEEKAMAKVKTYDAGWVLGRCPCGALNYVEPHGTTADCKRCKKSTEHQAIPFRAGE